MSFAGNVSLKADINCESGTMTLLISKWLRYAMLQSVAEPLAFLFAEEPGVFLEVEEQHVADVIERLRAMTEVVLVGEIYPQYGPDAKVRRATAWRGRLETRPLEYFRSKSP